MTVSDCQRKGAQGWRNLPALGSTVCSHGHRLWPRLQLRPEPRLCDRSKTPGGGRPCSGPPRPTCSKVFGELEPELHADGAPLAQRPGRPRRPRQSGARTTLVTHPVLRVKKPWLLCRCWAGLGRTGHQEPASTQPLPARQLRLQSACRRTPLTAQKHTIKTFQVKKSTSKNLERKNI